MRTPAVERQRRNRERHLLEELVGVELPPTDRRGGKRAGTHFPARPPGGWAYKAPVCRAILQRGSRCRHFTHDPSGLCVVHRPWPVEWMAEA